MKIGCGTVLFRKFPLEQALAAIRNIGFEYFETQAVGPWCPHVDVHTDDPEQLVKLKEKFGFKGITGLWAFGGNIISSDNAIETNCLSIQWAAAAGIPVLHTSEGKKPADMSEDEAYRILQDRLPAILEVAKKNNVKIAIEPHGTFSLTSQGLKKFMALGDKDVLGINYDACNVFRAGYVESKNNTAQYQTAGRGEDELAAMTPVADRVVHFHAKDLNAEKKCVALGQGFVNNKGCIELLQSIGYDGAISVETEGGDDFDQIVQLAKESYDYLNQIIKRA